MVYRFLKTEPRDANLKTEPRDANLAEILDRILDKGIVLEPWARVVSATTDLRGKDTRITVAPERRHKAFVVPASKLPI